MAAGMSNQATVTRLEDAVNNLIGFHLGNYWATLFLSDEQGRLKFDLTGCPPVDTVRDLWVAALEEAKARGAQHIFMTAHSHLHVFGANGGPQINGVPIAAALSGEMAITRCDVAKALQLLS